MRSKALTQLFSSISWSFDRICSPVCLLEGLRPRCPSRRRPIEFAHASRRYFVHGDLKTETSASAPGWRFSLNHCAGARSNQAARTNPVGGGQPLMKDRRVPKISDGMLSASSVPARLLQNSAFNGASCGRGRKSVLITSERRRVLVDDAVSGEVRLVQSPLYNVGRLRSSESPDVQIHLKPRRFGSPAGPCPAVGHHRTGGRRAPAFLAVQPDRRRSAVAWSPPEAVVSEASGCGQHRRRVMATSVVGGPAARAAQPETEFARRVPPRVRGGAEQGLAQSVQIEVRLADSSRRRRSSRQ